MNKIQDGVVVDTNNSLIREITNTFDQNIIWNYLQAYPIMSTFFALSDESLQSKVKLVRLVSRAMALASGIISPALEEENAQLRLENYSLREKIKAIEERISNIETEHEENVVVLREITRENAKEEIANLFSEGKTLYYSDIARELRLDLQLVVELANELIEEGKVEVAPGNP